MIYYLTVTEFFLQSMQAHLDQKALETFIERYFDEFSFMSYVGLFQCLLSYEVLNEPLLSRLSHKIQSTFQYLSVEQYHELLNVLLESRGKEYHPIKIELLEKINQRAMMFNCYPNSINLKNVFKHYYEFLGKTNIRLENLEQFLEKSLFNLVMLDIDDELHLVGITMSIWYYLQIAEEEFNEEYEDLIDFYLNDIESPVNDVITLAILTQLAKRDIFDPKDEAFARLERKLGNMSKSINYTILIFTVEGIEPILQYLKEENKNAAASIDELYRKRDKLLNPV